MRHIALGSELAGGVLVPTLLGLAADAQLGTRPLGILIGVGLALLLVTLTLVRLVKRR